MIDKGPTNAITSISNSHSLFGQTSPHVLPPAREAKITHLKKRAENEESGWVATFASGRYQTGELGDWKR